MVYGAKVTNTRTQTNEFYTGVTARRFKDRLYEHRTSFNRRKEKPTKLSDHVWKLKDQDEPYSVSWVGVENITPQPSTVKFAIRKNTILCSTPTQQL